MEPFFAIAVGGLAAAAVYLMLTGELLRYIFGLVLLSNAANLAIFVSGRLTPGAPPLIPEGAYAPAGTVANALPQALVLTAIVISFGMTAVVVMIALSAYLSDDDDTVDMDQTTPEQDP